MYFLHFLGPKCPGPGTEFGKKPVSGSRFYTLQESRKLTWEDCSLERREVLHDFIFQKIAGHLLQAQGIIILIGRCFVLAR
jgi:hypothetical protein